MWCFKITKDFISGKDGYVGTEYSSHGNSLEFTREYHSKVFPFIVEEKRFELFDDDRNKYFEGVITGDSWGFEPLDHFGVSFGCTICKINGEEL